MIICMFVHTLSYLEFTIYFQMTHNTSGVFPQLVSLLNSVYLYKYICQLISN